MIPPRFSVGVTGTLTAEAIGRCGVFAADEVAVSVGCVGATAAAGWLAETKRARVGRPNAFGAAKVKDGVDGASSVGW